MRNKGIGMQLIAAGVLLAIVGVSLAAMGIAVPLSAISIPNYAYVSKTYVVRQDGCWALYQSIKDPQTSVTPDSFTNKLPVLWVGATEDEARANLANTSWVAKYASYGIGGSIIYEDCCCYIVKYYTWRFVESPPPGNGTAPQPNATLPPGSGTPTEVPSELNLVTIAGAAVAVAGGITLAANASRRRQ